MGLRYGEEKAQNMNTRVHNDNDNSHNDHIKKEKVPAGKGN